MTDPAPGLYRHFKGGVYEVVAVARHSETEEPHVVYRALSAGGTWWVRPLTMFGDRIIIDGLIVSRFRPIESAD